MRAIGPLKGFKTLTTSQCGSSRFLSSLIRAWVEPNRDSYGYTRLLRDCHGDADLKQIHAQIITSGHQQNQYLAAKLVSQYTGHNSSNMDDARKVFDLVSDRDILMWNVVIRGYANAGTFFEALSIYNCMRLNGVYPNKYTYPFVLKACAAMGVGVTGKIVHGHVVKVGLETDLYVGNALVAFYAKCREIAVARKVFDEIGERDIVSLNSMIAGYTQNEFAEEAIVLFRQMLQDGSVGAPDHATLVGILPACAQAAAIQEGMWIHSYVIKCGMEIDAPLGSGLIAMYANCGHLDTARDLFRRLPIRNVVVWNVMIRGYGMHGHAKEALELFSKMLDSGIAPDSISFVCILSACSHAGLVDEGWELFRKMGDYRVEKGDEHYACMVDLLGRAGRLEDALEFIKSMPVNAGKDVYGALLGACRIHSNIELAEEVAERLFVLDPYNAGRYSILAKMYEDVGRWKDAANVRKVMRKKQIKKPLGCSTIEVDSALHTFGAEDESHLLKDQIFDTLDQLERVMVETEWQVFVSRVAMVNFGS